MGLITSLTRSKNSNEWHLHVVPRVTMDYPFLPTWNSHLHPFTSNRRNNSVNPLCGWHNLHFTVYPSFSYLPRVSCWGLWSALAPCSSGQWGSHCPGTGTWGTDSASPCTAPSPLISHFASLLLWLLDWQPRSPSSLWRGTAELRIMFGGDTDPWSAGTPPKRLEL